VGKFRHAVSEFTPIPQSEIPNPKSAFHIPKFTNRAKH
jgi:hypothetical protein